MADTGFESNQETRQPSSHYEEYVSVIAKGAGVIFGGNIINLALRSLLQIVVARYLGVDLYGIFTLGIAVFVIAEMVASLGLNKGMMRYVSLYYSQGDLGRVKGTILTAIMFSSGGGIVVMFILMALSGVLARNVFHTPQLGKVLVVLAAGIPFSALGTVFIFATMGFRIMKYKVYVKDLWELLSRIVLVLAFFLLGLRLEGAVAAFVLSIISGTFLGYTFFRRVFAPIFKSGEKAVFEPRVLIRFCWPLVFAGGFNLMEAWLSTFVLGLLESPRSVGIFGAAFRASVLIQGIHLSFSAIFSPIISKHHHKKEFVQLKALFKTVTKWIFLLSLPLAELMIFFSREIMSVFGRDFSEGAVVLAVLVTGQILNSVTGPLGVMIDMSGKTKFTLLNSALHFSLQIVLCFLLIPRHGVLGAAVAKTFSIAFLKAVRLVQVHLIFKFHPFQIRFLKPVAAGGIALVPLIVMKSIIPWSGPVVFALLGTAVFVSVYAGVLFLFGFDEEDMLLINRVRSKLVI